MNADDVLALLRENKVTLTAEHGELKVRAPRGVMNAALLDLLKEHKPALLARLAAGGTTAHAPRITPAMLPLVQLTQAEIDAIVACVPGGVANVQDIYPLAPLQEGILFHHLLEQEGDTYLSRSVIAFDTRARLDGFLAALQSVIDRHDILRSAVHWSGLAQPVQVVHRKAPLAIEEVSSTGGDAVALMLARTDPRRFRRDLRQAPLLAAFVAHDAASGEWQLVLLNHHIVCDHITLELVVGEIRMLLDGHGAQLPASLPFRNFIAQALRVPAAEHEAWFRRELGDVDAPTAPFGVLDVQGDNGRVEETHLPFDDVLALRIRDVARRQGVTPAVLFHVAWAQVVARCSGDRDDVVFGTVLTGRTQGSEGADRVFGMFLNTLPVRIRIAGVSVGTAVRDAYRQLLELLAHEQASLALAQRCSGVTPPLPLFTALLNYRHTGAAAANAAWDGIRVIDGETRNNYPLTMSVEDMGQAFALTALSVHGVDGARATGYLRTAIAALVDALATDPDRPLASLPIHTDDARRQLSRDWQGAVSTRYRDAALPVQIAAQAARTPDAVAVRDSVHVLTYAQFDAATHRLAHALQELGIARGARVGVHLERSAELLIALVAVQKTGAAYVMLDHKQTPDRLQRIVADAGVEVVLLDSRRSVLPVAGVDTVYLDDACDPDWLSEYPDAPLDVAIDADDSAYVLYTSGSTGVPKGVEIRHGGLTDYCAFAREGYYAEHLHGSLVVTSAAFDLTVPSLYVPLMTGGCVELLPAEDELIALAQTLERDAAPVLLRMTPSHLQGLLALADAQPRHSAHVFVIGGEAFSVVLARQLQAKYPHARIYNHYGPTETVVGCCWYDVTANLSTLDRTIPIGRPMSNTTLYVLSATGQLQPIGVAGELYIGGAGVARGYVNQPELTAAKFVADPFVPGARVYRSGDRVRWRADGMLEFLGRLDDQVKVRGFRIELGDIEAAVRRCAQVRDAAVAVRGEGADARLVAYVVADGVDLVALQAQLGEQLPVYMQPAAWVVLDRLPLTANGKVDRNALPAPEQAALPTREFAAPLGETEQAIAAIWERILKRDAIGRDVNFFELGGHSLLATRVVSEVAKRFGKTVPVRALFEHGTVARLAAHVDAQAATGYAAIPRLGRDGPLPLSFAQQRLWFIDRLEGGSAQYNMPIALRLTGRLDVAALQRALDALVARHEVLRTVYSDVGGAGMQVVQPAAPLPLRHADLRDAPDQEGELAALVQAEAAVPFDLARDSMVRATLVTLGDDAHALLFTLHHIAADGWSIGVLVQEFVALYGGRALPALPIQYADYAAWQRARLQGEALEQQLGYWRGRLAGLPAVHGLPLDRPRPAQQRFAGRRVERGIDRTTLDALHALARRHEASLFMVLHAAFAALLARWSGETDIVVGTPIAGRTHKDVEPLIGFFVNTLVLRSDLSGDPAFDALVAQSRAMTLDAYAHQDVPFEMLVEDLKPTRNLSHAPLCQVLFSLGNTPQSELELPGLQVASLGGGDDVAKVDLQLGATESAHGLQLTWLYADSLFEPASIERLAGAYTRVLHAVAAHPSLPIGRLPLLDDAEREQFDRWNDTAAEFPADACIHQLFEAQVARRPDAIALVCGEETLTYAELNRQANRVAHHLRGEGVRPDTLIGLCAERSPEMVIGMLGILKAGAAYVPFDPQYPEDRLAFMLDDSAVEIVLTHSDVLQALPMLAERTVLPLDPPLRDAFLADCADVDIAPSDIGLRPDHLAYVIYTSGSTGRPKGVLVEHRGLCNLAVAQGARFGVRADSRVLQFASLSFDASISEVAMTLCSGACLHLASRDDLRPVEPLLATLRDGGITHVTLPPTALVALADHAHVLAPLTVIAAGEALPAALARHWAARHRVLNAYGPTETTVCATIFDCMPDQSAPVPIGAPMANMRIRILDRNGRQVPVGVAGEIHIGGVGLARGYLRRPELSAERFVADVEGIEPRLYRTGDVGRWRADGVVEYLGRNDDQVKVRGFRIELGEIEAQLRACPGVRDAAVVARDEADGDRRLVAYVVAQPHAAPAVADLRARLVRELAEYMVPGAFVMLPALPLTPNGKVDRRALPAPDQAVAATRPYAAPVGEFECAIADAWQELLGLQQVGRHDDFFELGGHSLLAVKLTAMLSDRLGIALEVRTLFRHTTLHALAAYAADAARRDADWQPLTMLHAEAGLPMLYIVPAAGLTLLSYQPLARALDGALAVGVFEPRGLDGRLPPCAGIDEIVALNLQALLAHDPAGPYLLAGHSFGGAVAFEMARTLRAQGRDVELLLLDSSLYQDDTQREQRPTATAYLRQLFAEELVTHPARTKLDADDAAFRDFVAAKLQQQGLLSRNGGIGALDRFIAVLDAQMAALAVYRPSGRHAGPARLLQARDGAIARRPRAELLAHYAPYLADPRIVDVDGGHLSMLSPLHAGALARAVLRTSAVAAETA